MFELQDCLSFGLLFHRRLWKIASCEGEFPFKHGKFRSCKRLKSLGEFFPEVYNKSEQSGQALLKENWGW